MERIDFIEWIKGIHLSLERVQEIQIDGLVILKQYVNKCSQKYLESLYDNGTLIVDQAEPITYKV